MSKIAILAKLTAVEGKRDELVEVLKAQIDLVADETGTEVYALHTVSTDEVSVWFYELYADKAAFEHHGSTEAMKALGPKLKGLTASRPELVFLTPVKAKGV